MKSTLISAVNHRIRVIGLLILLTVVGISNVQADGHNRIADGLRKTLMAAVPYPSGIEHIQEVNAVQLSLMITEDRKLDVIRVEGGNIALNRYVLDQLDGISMTRFGGLVGKMIKVKLSFAAAV